MCLVWLSAGVCSRTAATRLQAPDVPAGTTGAFEIMLSAGMAGGVLSTAPRRFGIGPAATHFRLGHSPVVHERKLG